MLRLPARYSPVGEYIRLLIMRRLSLGPAPVEELDALAKAAAERAGIRYNWKIWPRLLEREVEVKGGVAHLTPLGRWLLEQTAGEVEEYVRKTLGIELPIG